MKRITLKQIYKEKETFAKKEVVVCGWAKTIRDSKAFGFIELNDGSYFKNTQIVFDREKVSNYDEVAKQNVGACFCVKGNVVLTPDRPQPFEINASEIEILGTSTPDYPLQKKRHTLEYLRTLPHLRPRTNTFNAVFKIRSEAAYAIHKFFNERGFVYVHTPIITGSDCEGAGAMFQVTTMDLDNVPTVDGKADYTKDFFGKKSSLTVSGQLDVENFALCYSNVYTFGPTFRAEHSNTVRHAAEFWMIEPELAFADLSDDMDCAEDMVKFIINYVLSTCPEEINFLNQFVDNGLIDRLKNVVNNEFVRLSYTEAISILEKVKDKFDNKNIYWGMDLESEHERYITEQVYKKPVFLTDYPKEIKAFYMRLNDDNKTVAASDLLVPGIGELVGGSQREERLDVLEKRMKECGLKPEDYKSYLDLRKYGGVTHSGYGLGFERMIMYLTGISNIRDVLPFPRTVGSLES